MIEERRKKGPHTTMTTGPHFQQQQVSLGATLIMIEDEEFIGGFETRYDSYHTYHQQGEVIEISTLLFLLKNGWNGERSEMWTAGYIMGWLAGFYEQEDGQLALSVPVTQQCEGAA